MKTSTIAIALSLISTFAIAGQDRGGGDVLVCKEGSLLSKKEVFLADTYQFLSKNGHKLSVKLSKERKLEVIRNQLNLNTEGLGDAIIAELKNLKFDYVNKLEELEGDNIQLPAGCKKRQLAIQDIDSGIIRTNKSLYGQLSSWEHALFEAHEAFIRLKNPGMDTTPVRNEILKVVTGHSFGELIGNELPAVEEDNKKCSKKMIKSYRKVIDYHQQNLSQGHLVPKEEILKDLEGMTFNTLGDFALGIQRSASLAKVYEGIDGSSFGGVSTKSMFTMSLKVTLENNYRQSINGDTRNWTMSSPINGSIAEKMMTLNICDAIPSKN